MAKELDVLEKIKLDDSMALAYDTIKMSYDYYKAKEGLEYSFNEYLIRCGLTTLFQAFEKEVKDAKIFEGHA